LEIIETLNGDEIYRFRCVTQVERYRAETLFTKEAGTVSWIRDSVREGDVFVDVGANIGIYSMLAARRVGPSGAVYAFEPHTPNFVSLLHNIGLNKFIGTVWPLSCALHDREAFLDFNYYDLTAGSSMSQLGNSKDSDEQPFAPVVTELKSAMPLDTLLSGGHVRHADHVKIDVDGNELLVLRGMRKLLIGPRRPKTLQVEINIRYKAELSVFMAECGYEQYLRHDTLHGQSLIAAGTDPELVAHNALFRPRY
jgi:FkbM family methyltransferase